MRFANIMSVYRKGSWPGKANSQPVYLLPNLLKVFERCVYKQPSKFFDEILSKYQQSYRKRHAGFMSGHFCSWIIVVKSQSWIVFLSFKTIFCNKNF